MTSLSQNPYAPPSGAHEAFRPDPLLAASVGDLDRQLALIQPGGMTRAAAALTACHGGMLLLGALQLWDLVRLAGAMAVVPFVMAVLGVASLLLSVRIFRQRVWAAPAGLVIGVVAALGMALWFFVATLSGFISLIMLLVPVMAVLAAVFSGLAIGPIRRTAAVRRRLADEGIPVDF